MSRRDINFDILPLRDLIENQSISTLSFLFWHCHVAYDSARPQEDLLQINLSVLIGLVKTSARFSLVWIFCKSTLLSSTTSRTKWYCTLICFVLEWKTGFLAISKALWLSQNTRVFYCLWPSSSNTICIQIASLQACVAAMYSASVVDRGTTACSFETQLTVAPASVNT